MKLKEIAKLVLGKVVGDEALDISGVSSIDKARAGDMVFVLDKKFLAAALKSKASALVTSQKTKVSGKSAILADNPRLAMAQILALFAPEPSVPKGVHPTAVVPKSCQVSKSASIGAFVVLGENVSIGDQCVIYPHTFIDSNCRLGRDCVVHSHVSIYARVSIGDRVILHSGCRLGIDGYGYEKQGEKHIKIPQLGGVIIEDDVELYANVCVSCGTLEPTVIGAGTKIDNLSHIAHNCKIGRNCAIVSLVGFAGSVVLEDNVYVAGQAGFNGHITVGENTVVLAKSGVTKDVPANSIISGFPAQDHRKEVEYRAALRRLAKKAKP
jgi:UDP-3-O-[3-hydroxymyristoyl] glucosamine N-acyltransferase